MGATGTLTEKNPTIVGCATVLVKIHSTLFSAFAMPISRQLIPVLLIKTPTSMTEYKSNIDKLLQYAFLHKCGPDSPPNSRYMFYAYQYISDYAVGLSITEAQLNDFFRAQGEEAKHIARAVFAFFAKNPIKDTPRLQHLIDICKSFRGDNNLTDDFAFNENDGF